MIAAGIVLMWLAVLLGIVGLIAWRTSGAREYLDAEHDDDAEARANATTQPAWQEQHDTQEPRP